ncbi:helicase-related protein [Enhygromyxa salina]|uniref:helicase-related protein n=1 Tax=Enhygromyxa salina TaxID=215803 RepID=UPI0015E64BF0|nr:helicase-related protein [Enhygromyxa salina]
MLATQEPDLDALVEYACTQLPDLAHATLERRVRDIISWRARLTGRTAPKPRRHEIDRQHRWQLDLFDPTAPPIEAAEWPDPRRLPFNWPKDRIRVEHVVYPDLRESDEVLLVMGYTSLQHLCDFVGSLDIDLPRRVRVVFGNEPFVGRDVPARRPTDTLRQDVLDYWLERGVSIRHARAVLVTLEAVRAGRLATRIARRSPGLHAKMFIGSETATIGSSNFTYPGLAGQLEANVRLGPRAADRQRLDEARRLGEIYWRLALPFDDPFISLLEQLLRKVSWQEALARACAELLEGEWARLHLRDELGYSERLWPSQLQGIGQALYVLMEVGSVLIADATGSGKTRTGAWLLRTLRQHLVAMGRPIADPVLVSPPTVTEIWANELHEAEVRVEAYSHGALSSSRATTHGRVVKDVETARLLALDEAHNFINPSNRSAIVTTNLADHVVLFTATPINRDVSDLLGIVDLLGADNLDDETLKILLESGWRRKRPLDDDDRLRLRRAVGGFTVRRTKSMFNTLIEREPTAYHNAEDQPCRYPDHKPRYYQLGEAKRDRKIAAEITTLARALRGVLWLRKPLQLTRALADEGWTADKYVAMRLQSARALARYQVRVSLRSSRAALWEHLHGTDAARGKFGLSRLDKDDSGEVLAKLEKLRDRGPPKSPLTKFLPEWLQTRAAFRQACDEERDLYEQISACCDQLSTGREQAKVKLLRNLINSHRLIVAFDSRPITLALLRELLDGASEFDVLIATGGRTSEQKAVQRAFALGAKTRPSIALCSNAMAEGVNLQQASAVVHLDMPSVVRIAEQRVGRIDRMDSPHARVESWWPKDADEFALSTADKLGARLDLVGDLLGANVSLPTDAENDEIIQPEHLLEQMKAQQARQIDLIDDAFAPVRGLIEGPRALVDAATYAALRGSDARVLSAVATVRAAAPWGFFTIPGTRRRAPRWAFIDGSSGRVITALDVIADELRIRLAVAEDIELDATAVDVMDTLLAKLQAAATSLLPRRKQRALEQMRELLGAWARHSRRDDDEVRLEIINDLLGLSASEDQIDYDELVDSWLAAIRPRWRQLLLAPGRRRRSSLRRLAGLTPLLKKQPLETAALVEMLGRVQRAKPLAERIVAAIIGVPGK